MSHPALCCCLLTQWVMYASAVTNSFSSEESLVWVPGEVPKWSTKDLYSWWTDTPVNPLCGSHHPYFMAEEKLAPEELKTKLHREQQSEAGIQWEWMPGPAVQCCVLSSDGFPLEGDGGMSASLCRDLVSTAHHSSHVKIPYMLGVAGHYLYYSLNYTHWEGNPSSKFA